MQRRPTSFDIAALAGVSQPTVSRALSGSSSVSDETRRRVLDAAEQLRYKVDKNASGLRRQQSKTLALLFFEEWPEGALINPFYLSLVGPMVRRCAEHGYDLLISFQQLSSDWHVDYEDSRKADGIILLGYGDYLEYRPRLEQLVARGAHFVRWGTAGESPLGTTVSSDNEQGGFDATTHLLQQGRRKIAFVGTAGAGFPEVHERWRGYCRALRARRVARLAVGLAVADDLVRSELAGNFLPWRVSGVCCTFRHGGIFRRQLDADHHEHGRHPHNGGQRHGDLVVQTRGKSRFRSEAAA